MTPICAGGSNMEWACSVSRDKDGDTRIWVPGLTFSALIVRKEWNCILTRAPLGEGGYFEPPSRFLAISSKPMQVSPPNVQYPLSLQFYTLS